MLTLCLPCRVSRGAASRKSPRRRILVLGTSGAHWPARWHQFGGTKRLLKMYRTYYQIVAFLKCRQVICTKTIITLPDAPSSSSSTALPAPSTKTAFLCACGQYRQPGAGIWERLDSYPLLIAPLKKHTPEGGLAWRKEGCFNRWFNGLTLV